VLPDRRSLLHERAQALLRVRHVGDRTGLEVGRFDDGLMERQAHRAAHRAPREPERRRGEPAEPVDDRLRLGLEPVGRDALPDEAHARRLSAAHGVAGEDERGRALQADETREVRGRDRRDDAEADLRRAERRVVRDDREVRERDELERAAEHRTVRDREGRHLAREQAHRRAAERLEHRAEVLAEVLADAHARGEGLALAADDDEAQVVLRAEVVDGVRERVQHRHVQDVQGRPVEGQLGDAVAH